MNQKPSDPHPAEQDTSSIANSDSHAFVIRIWLEDVESAESSVLWRGYITHVLDYRHRYFQDLSGIIRFITPYLENWTTKR